MLLFFISFLLVFATSYLITSVITPKKSILGLIYIFLIAFAQLVLTFEVLSLFNSIKTFWVLITNILFFVGSSIVWHKKSKPLWTLETGRFKNRVINSLKLDKSLFLLYIGFCTLLISAMILCILMPITSADAQAYHVARSLFWVLQGSLNHFDTQDIRNLCLPINSEILYSWVILFVRKDVFLGFFSFVGYIMSIISVYNILGYMGFCTRRKLWVIFILSSFSSVIIQTSSTETDIIIAGLISASMALFWNSLKTDKKTPLYMSALAYALAIGTKTPALIMIPGVGLLLLGLCAYYKKYKPLGLFLGFGLINFIIFSSYNYILNFIHFGNFMGSESFIVVSKNYYGIKGMFANIIKYIFMFFDFTGFRWADYLNEHMKNLRELTLNFLHLGYVKDGIYTIPYSVNRLIIEPLVGSGILGFFVFIPTLAWSLIKPIFKPKSKKTIFIFAFAFMFIINVLIISYVLAYMIFSVRFIMSFMVISSPILVYSYLSKKNPIKYIIIAFSLFYLIAVSTHIWVRPISKIGKVLMQNPSITYLREIPTCKTYHKTPQYNNAACILKRKIKLNFKPNTKILAFITNSENTYLLKSLEFEGYKLDLKRLEDVKEIDIDNYDVVIIQRKVQDSTVIKHYEERKNDYKVNGKKVVINKKTDVPCFYVTNNLIPKPASTIPFKVECMITQEYVKNNPLEFLGSTGLVTPQTYKKPDYYMIYRNTNRPLTLKKIILAK